MGLRNTPNTQVIGKQTLEITLLPIVPPKIILEDKDFSHTMSLAYKSDDVYSQAGRFMKIYNKKNTNPEKATIYFDEKSYKNLTHAQIRDMNVLKIMSDDYQKIIDQDAVILNPLDEIAARKKIQKIVFGDEHIYQEGMSIDKKYSDAKILLTESGNLVQYGAGKHENATGLDIVRISMHDKDVWKTNSEPIEWKNFLKKNQYAEVKVNGNNILAHDSYNLYINDAPVKIIWSNEMKVQNMIVTLANVSKNGKIVALEWLGKKYHIIRGQSAKMEYLEKWVWVGDKNGLRNLWEKTDLEYIFDVQINDKGTLAYIGEKDGKVMIQLWSKYYEVENAKTPDVFARDKYTMTLDNDDTAKIRYTDNKNYRRECDIHLSMPVLEKISKGHIYEDHWLIKRKEIIKNFQDLATLN